MGLRSIEVLRKGDLICKVTYLSTQEKMSSMSPQDKLFGSQENKNREGAVQHEAVELDCVKKRTVWLK